MPDLHNPSIEGLVELPLRSNVSSRRSAAFAAAPSSTIASIYTRRITKLIPLSSVDRASLTRDRKKIIIAVAVEPAEGYGCDASGDLWRLLTYDLQHELMDPSFIIYILTERLNVKWLGDFKAIVIVDTPIRANIRSVIETAALQCSSGGNCTLWMACDGMVQESSGNSAMIPADGWKQALTGEDLKTWALQMHPSCLLTVVLEVCYSGNFMNLPYEFATDGKLVSRWSQVAAPKGPRIVCVAACRKNEVAYLGKWEGMMCGAFTLMLYFLRSDRTHKRQPGVYLKDIESLVAPDLDRWGGQHPVVAMSYAGQYALLSLS
ncbi:hypothetical protein FRB93_007071 [Tulasnella sp. JGI-2019a]|nr:hypothetical protein FRB93_007071 [Tulasnella sp. JGI-2019a]